MPEEFPMHRTPGRGLPSVGIRAPVLRRDRGQGMRWVREVWAARGWSVYGLGPSQFRIGALSLKGTKNRLTAFFFLSSS